MSLIQISMLPMLPEMLRSMLPGDWSHLLRRDPLRVPDCAHQVPPLQRVQRLHHQHRPRQIQNLGVHPLPPQVTVRLGTENQEDVVSPYFCLSFSFVLNIQFWAKNIISSQIMI